MFKFWRVHKQGRKTHNCACEFCIKRHLMLWTYLCSLFQQQLHTVSISNHARTVQGLECAMHPVNISSLSHAGDGSINTTAQRTSTYFKLQCKIEGPTLRIRSSTLSWGKERMAAMVRMSRSDKEYLLWILCIMYHIVELMCNWGPWHPGRGVTIAHWKEQMTKTACQIEDQIFRAVFFPKCCYNCDFLCRRL